jgi:hypothetical protein
MTLVREQNVTCLFSRRCSTMDLRDYPIGEDAIPAREANLDQLREAAEEAEDQAIGDRLKEVANWRAFFKELHDRIDNSLSGQMDADNLDMVRKILAWETQSIIETVLKEGQTLPFPSE